MTLTDKQREEIRKAARKHAAESRKAQGLPPTVTDPTVLRFVATVLLGKKP